MELTMLRPPVTTVPVNPMPPASPAQDFIQRFGDDLTQLGATRVEATSPDTVRLVYTNNFAGVQAAGALKDAVEGVKLVVDNQSLTADYWQATGDNVATWLEQSGIVEKVERRESFPIQLGVFGNSMQAESALATLLRSQLDDGTTIDVARRMWIM